MFARLRSRKRDSARYEFALQQALETTQDSLELSTQDMKERSTQVSGKQEREKQALEELMQPKDREEKKAAEKKAAEAEKKNKAPTLRRKGETVPPAKP